MPIMVSEAQLHFTGTNLFQSGEWLCSTIIRERSKSLADISGVTEKILECAMLNRV